jgi:prepilin-type processing-associated H-X9-DG protein
LGRRELERISPWQSSYRLNPAVLGMKWEEVKHTGIPLLIEKRPNHHGKFNVLYTDGSVIFTDKQPELK